MSVPTAKRWSIVAACSLLTAIASGQEPERPLVPKPEPVPPPPATAGQARNPMVLLSEPQDYSASRVSSYEPHGGPRDNVWVPTDGEPTFRGSGI